MFCYNGAKVVQGFAQAADHTSHQARSNRNFQWLAQRHHLAARMNAVHFAQRHQQNVMIAKSDDFGQRGNVVLRGLDPANLANGRERALGLDHKTDQLNDTPASLGDPRVPDALQGGLEVRGRGLRESGRHAFND